jgi:hypothetical protein
MTTKPVVVRGPDGRATVLHLVGLKGSVCEVTDDKGLIELAHGDVSHVATVWTADVFAMSDSIRTGDKPDWTFLSVLTP